MNSFQKHFTQCISESKENSQYLLQMNIDSIDKLYDIAQDAKNAKDLKTQIIKNKKLIADLKDIDFKEINWEEIYNALDEACAKKKKKLKEEPEVSKIEEPKLDEDDSVVSVSSDVATVTKPLVGKKKEEDLKEDEDDFSDYDYNSNGVIDEGDLVYLVKDLSQGALMEVIDLVADFLEEKYEKVSDQLQDGETYVYENSDDNTNEGVIRKKVVRGGKKMIVKKSSKAGYKLKDGKEVKMSPKEIRNRIKSAKKASKKRKAKSAGMARKRKISMKKRG